VTGFTAVAATSRYGGGMPKKRFTEDQPDFMGPRLPTLRERLAWAGITARSGQMRESRPCWKRGGRSRCAALSAPLGEWAVLWHDKAFQPPEAS
jgi:hypothetical protein